MIKVIFSFLLRLPRILTLYFIDKRSERGNLHLYGIYGFFGLMGQGKTISMVHYLDSMRNKYGNRIYIMTNFYYRGEDFHFLSWQQLLDNYDKPIIVAWDEIQNEFNSRDFKSFPISLLTQLTQVRKGNGIQLLYTAQKYHLVDKNFRSLSMGVNECKTWLGRFTFYKSYSPDDYEQFYNEINVEKKHHIRPRSVTWFIQDKKLRGQFDSYKMLQSAKTKDYMDRLELSQLDNIS